MEDEKITLLLKIKQATEELDLKHNNIINIKRIKNKFNITNIKRS